MNLLLQILLRKLWHADACVWGSITYGINLHGSVCFERLGGEVGVGVALDAKLGIYGIEAKYKMNDILMSLAVYLGHIFV